MVTQDTSSPKQLMERSNNSGPMHLDALSNRLVRVYAPYLPALEDSLSITYGSILADSVTDSGPRYISDAFVPATPWRPLTQWEFNLVETRQSLGLHRTVGIVPICGPDTARFFRERAHDLSGTYEDIEVYEHPLLSNVMQMVHRSCRVDGPVIYSNIGRHAPGLVTVTFDRRRDARLGLHLDNWERTDLSNADFVRNRIAINVGAEDRYFLFINLTIKTICSVLQEQHHVTPQTKAELTTEFLQRYSNYPIIRLRLRPGEAYVAPTENIIHDASSMGARHTGYHITLRGRFTVLEPEIANATISDEAFNAFYGVDV